MFADRYEVRGILGQGGMGVVYDAVAHGANGFRRRVALKQLSSSGGTGAKADEERFLDEARVASRLHHAGIVGVLDYGILGGAPFQVLELVDGIDALALMRRVRDRGLRVPVDIALYITAEVAHALAYAHTAEKEDGSPLGIVHRDVKPSNVFVSRSGDVKLGDFGIALSRDQIRPDTAGSWVGTRLYMPPEQLLGGAIDARTDIFALGCTLHVLLTGVSPLARKELPSVVDGEVELAKDLPLDVEAIIARAIMKDPRKRYQTAREMAASIGEALITRLKTDPKSRLVPWLDALEVGLPKAVLAPAPAILRRGPGETRVFETLDELPKQSPARPDDERPKPKPRSRRTSRTTVFAYGLLLPLVLGTAALLYYGARHRGEDRGVALTVDAAPSAAPFVVTDPPPPPPEDAEPPANASPSSTPHSRNASATRHVQRVDVTGVSEHLVGPDAPKIQKSLAARSLPCFRDMQPKPGVAASARFTLYADGGVSELRTTYTCTGQNCRTYPTPWIPDSILECIREVTKATHMELNQLQHPIGTVTAIYFTPVW